MSYSGQWQEVELRALGRIVTGRTPLAAHPEHFGSGMPFLTPSDMDGQRSIKYPARRLSKEGTAALSRAVVPHGVGVSCIGWQMGKSILIDEPSVTNQQINTIIVDPAKADRRFVYYAMLRKRDELFRLASSGSRTPILKKSDFEKVTLFLPPLEEQKAIAHILGTLDDKIELNRRMNQTLEAMARALFKSWFVDFDPVRAKAEGRTPPGLDPATAALFPDSFENSELGWVPAGWEVKPLSQVLEINPTCALRVGNIAPYLDMANVSTNSARPANWFDRQFTSGSRFRNGDVLMARITPCLENGKTAYVDFLKEGQVGWGSTEFLVLRSRPPLPSTYAYLVARADDFRSHAIANMTGSSGRQRVPATCFDSYKVVAPSERVAERFGSETMPLFEKIKENDEASRTLSSIRDELLPRLMQGNSVLKMHA